MMGVDVCLVTVSTLASNVSIQLLLQDQRLVCDVNSALINAPIYSDYNCFIVAHVPQ